MLRQSDAKRKNGLRPERATLHSPWQHPGYQAEKVIQRPERAKVHKHSPIDYILLPLTGRMDAYNPQTRGVALGYAVAGLSARPNRLGFRLINTTIYPNRCELGKGNYVLASTLNERACGYSLGEAMRSTVPYLHGVVQLGFRTVSKWHGRNIVGAFVLARLRP